MTRTCSELTKRIERNGRLAWWLAIAASVMLAVSVVAAVVWGFGAGYAIAFAAWFTLLVSYSFFADAMDAVIDTVAWALGINLDEDEG